MKKTKPTNCECCGNYVYDDDYGYYVCEMDLDEDEMERFLKGSNTACPFYRPGGDYKTASRQ